ncbi:hypothetical protein I549_1694 [Mycobacterium avium subsp. avium 2285 (R)]|uniref:Uncharacterized protein n=1 Tax=Mycobacterium avium (strain 104) TaxID=243243 RepID=A0A0H3A5M5_MYCA1|nr:hypothetical protein MAV_4320 [Mycobacterium avium 104]EUA37876.1 hypothetical protein I549_1694 [Mycobacterium avium subsp. avium 2285 (R)]
MTTETKVTQKISPADGREGAGVVEQSVRPQRRRITCPATDFRAGQ